MRKIQKRLCVLLSAFLTAGSFASAGWAETNAQEFTDWQSMEQVSGPEGRIETDGVQQQAETAAASETVIIPETAITAESSQIPETTVAPETVWIPETTMVPETTIMPETTMTPETTWAPETTMTPETTWAPETTMVPETTMAPETTMVPETTIAPETTMVPETTIAPETTLGSETTEESETTRVPENSQMSENTTESGEQLTTGEEISSETELQESESETEAETEAETEIAEETSAEKLNEETQKVDAVALPDQPGGLNLEVIENKNLLFSWKPVASAEEYWVFRKSPGVKWTLITKVPAEKNNYLDLDVKRNIKYSYAVRAAKTVGKKVYLSSYDWISAAVFLAAPRLVSAQATAQQSILFSWEPVTDADGYCVYRRYENKKWKLLGQVKGQSVRSFEDNTVLMNQKAIYTVRAYQYVNQNCYLSPFETTDCSAMVTFDTPKVTEIVPESYQSIRIRWNPVSGADGYMVYRKEAGKSWIIADTVSKNTVSLTDTGVLTGVYYYYAVRALKKGAEGTSLSGFERPGAVRTALGAAVFSGKSDASGIRLDWNRVDGADGYYVYRRLKTSTAWAVISEGTAQSYHDVPPEAGQAYCYAIRAYRVINGRKVIGTAGKTFSAFYGLAAPTLTSVAMKTYTAVLTWSAVPFADGYCVYRRIGVGGWTKVAQLPGAGTLAYEDFSIENQNTYHYTVRAYRTLNGVTSQGYYNTEGIRLDVYKTVSWTTDFGPLYQYDPTPLEYGVGPGTYGVRNPAALDYQARYSRFNVTCIGEDRPIISLLFTADYEAVTNGMQHTVRILDILKEKNVRATFGLTGNYVRNNPEIVWRIIREGHVIIHHSNRHNEAGVAALSLEAQLEDTNAMTMYMKQNYGYDVTTYSFHSGKYSIRSMALMQALGYHTVFWSFAYADYNYSAYQTGAALNIMVNSLHNGAIYLLHPMAIVNVNALSDFIDITRARGFAIQAIY